MSLIQNALDEIKRRALRGSNIGDYLVTLFTESLKVNPKLIVELGVRHGESTFALERVARICNSKMISVDIRDCSKVCTYEDWLFVRSDDVEFAKVFEGWCEDRNITPEVNILLIDTSHLYEHTCREIKYWFPHLSERVKVFFHDTNLTAWDNKRGVIRALEDFLHTSLREKENFTEIIDGWLVRHYSSCNGFTILERPSPKRIEA